MKTIDMRANFKISYTIKGVYDWGENKGNEDVVTTDGLVEFYHSGGDYGNGWGMAIKSKHEPFGLQSYDIRYDHDFSRYHMIAYIVQFYSSRFDGKDGTWKLIGITVNETDETID